MVKGIEIFQEYFKEYTEQYVLIGGAACSVSFEEQEMVGIEFEQKVMVNHSFTDLISQKMSVFQR